METAESGPVLRPLLPQDWTAARAIYAAGIAGGEATFEAAPPSWEEFDAGRLPHAQGRRRGTMLLGALIAETEAAGIWTM